MHSILNIREIDTMSSYSWNTEKSMKSSDISRCATLTENRIKSPNPQNHFSNPKYPIKTLCFSHNLLIFVYSFQESLLSPFLFLYTFLASICAYP